MPWFALHVVQTDYELTPGNPFPVYRHSPRVEIGGASWLSPHCLFDTGAPFSIMSNTVAQALGAALVPFTVTRSPIPTFENGQPVAPTPADHLLGWWDPRSRQLIHCLLAETSIRFRNTDSGAVSDPLRLVAKVLQSPTLAFNDRFLLLGVHLLTANAGRLHIEGQPWGLGGPGLFFPP